jgi:hypothetical protein
MFKSACWPAATKVLATETDGALRAVHRAARGEVAPAVLVAETPGGDYATSFVDSCLRR